MGKSKSQTIEEMLKKESLNQTTLDILKDYKNANYTASEVFLNVPFTRKFDNIEVILNENNKSLEVNFEKKNISTAYSVFCFYIDDEFDNTEIKINNCSIDIKNKTLIEILIEIIPFLKEQNKLITYALSQEEFTYMLQLLVYKVTEDRDDEYFLREQLDSFN